MEIAKVIFRVDDETRDINCYQIEVKEEKRFFYEGKLYGSLLPIIERRIQRANSIVSCYERNCVGKRRAQLSANFWTNQLAGRGTTFLNGEIENV